MFTQAGLWQTAMTTKIEGLSLSADEKNDLKDQVSKIKTELVKNVNLDSARVTKLINTLGLMGGTDLIELTRKRLGPPLQGIGFSLSMNTDFKVTVEKAD